MWDVTCQPLDHSKCDKVPMRHGQLATTSRRGKVPIFKPKAPSFHTTEFSYLNYFPQKIDQIFGFWAGQGLKLRRNTCFCQFKSSLGVNFHASKPERLSLSTMWTSIFCLSKGAHMAMTPGNDSWNVILGACFESVAKVMIDFFS